MAIWSMLEPPGATDAERIVAVKEGWSWGAFVFGPFWLVWRRLWLVLLCWLAAAVLFSVATAWLRTSEALSGLLWLLASVWFALEANGVRRWTLLRRGWRLLGMAAGRRLDDAEQRWFAEAGPAAPALLPRAGLTPLRGAASEGVIGLFPEPFPSGRGR